MAATKQRVKQKATKKKGTRLEKVVGAAAGKMAKTLQRLGKPVFRTADINPVKYRRRVDDATAAALPKPKPKVFKATKSRRKCLCNCNQSSTNFFRRGHVQRFRSNLKALREGQFNGATPAQVMGAEVAEALGPWTQMARSGGWKPKTTDYTVVR